MIGDQLIAQFEGDFLFALKETLIRRNEELTIDNYISLSKAVLVNILQNNDYRYITRNNKARDRIINNYTREKILTYICLKIASYDAISVTSAYNQMNESYVEALFKYANSIFPKIVTGEWLSPQKLVYDDSIEQGISDVNFYRPTNLCREAVLSGKQIKVSCSSANINKMNAYSSVGKKRTNQEDSYYIGTHPKNPEFKIMLVADGMGGHNDGEKASNTTTKELINWFENLPESEFTNENNSEFINNLNEKIKEIDAHIKELYPGAGTTLCMAIVKNKEILICNIGDSKAFVLKNDKISFVTTPDNIPNVLGIPDPFDRFHVKSNSIINSIGCMEEPVLKCTGIKMKPNNDYKVIICSDGVTDLLSNSEVTNIIANCKNFDDISHELVNVALNVDSNFKNYFKEYFGNVVGKKTYEFLYKNLASMNMDEDYECIIPAGKDNTTAVAGHIVK